jgi:serine phosphatase RsbU (regulator of sigma subunit)
LKLDANISVLNPNDTVIILPMETLLVGIATRLWPDLKNLNQSRRLVGTGDVIALLWTLPLALIGLTWLAMETRLEVVRQHWEALILFSILLLIFTRLGYFLIIEIRSDRYASADGSLASMVQWTVAFLFGPTTLWLLVLWQAANALLNWIRTRSAAARWAQARSLAHEVAGITLGGMTALTLYKRWGGVYPLPGLTRAAILPAFGALAVHFSLVLAIWSVFIAYGLWMQNKLAGRASIKPLLTFLALALGLQNLAHPFAIQAAGIYAQNGILMFAFFMSGLFLVAYLGRQLSWAAESSRQRARQLEQLERLGRTILNALPDTSTLPPILEEHVPAMFPSARIAIHLFPDQLMLRSPVDWLLDFEPIKQWVCTSKEPKAYSANQPLPWGNPLPRHDPVIVAPIFSIEDNSNIGCIYIELRSLSQPWHHRALTNLFPAVKNLADQISSALHQAQVYEESLQYEQTLQELKFAGRIQSSFLPKEIPTLEGWELAVTMMPARQTSGDFFDFIPLANGKIGMLIADVADKGIGAALYMALSRTLIRTYAMEYVDVQPDVVFFAANERLLADARANLFVTAFYGVLDPTNAMLTYCNAGHNPPYLFSQRRDGRYTALSATGIPLGIERDSVWENNSIHIDVGDALVLYTDGIPDAQNPDGEFFRERRMVEVVRGYLGLPAQDLMDSVIEEIRRFSGDAAQYDDITLLVLTRDK